MKTIQQLLSQLGSLVLIQAKYITFGQDSKGKVEEYRLLKEAHLPVAVLAWPSPNWYFIFPDLDICEAGLAQQVWQLEYNVEIPFVDFGEWAVDQTVDPIDWVVFARSPVLRIGVRDNVVTLYPAAWFQSSARINNAVPFGLDMGYVLEDGVYHTLGVVNHLHQKPAVYKVCIVVNSGP